MDRDDHVLFQCQNLRGYEEMARNHDPTLVCNNPYKAEEIGFASIGYIKGMHGNYKTDILVGLHTDKRKPRPILRQTL